MALLAIPASNTWSLPAAVLLHTPCVPLQMKMNPCCALPISHSGSRAKLAAAEQPSSAHTTTHTHMRKHAHTACKSEVAASCFKMLPHHTQIGQQHCQPAPTAVTPPSPGTCTHPRAPNKACSNDYVLRLRELHSMDVAVLTQPS